MITNKNFQSKFMPGKHLANFAGSYVMPSTEQWLLINLKLAAKSYYCTPKIVLSFYRVAILRINFFMFQAYVFEIWVNSLRITFIKK